MAAQVEKRDPYSGETKKHIRDGCGVYNYPNKYYRYEGEWKEAKKHGHGKLLMGDGSYYEGEFTEGEITGYGCRYFGSTGNTYTGQFYMGELHGQGVMKYRDGTTYEGEWHRNKRQGYGILRLPDSSIYQGYMYNHKRHGEGTHIYSNGDRYDGDWVIDKRQGHGELRYTDGSVYDGQWKNDQCSGEGTLMHSSGFIYEGMWVNGRPAMVSHKLMIKTPSPYELVQGQPFSLEVECQNEEGELVQDQGREIQIMAGIKYVPPKEVTSSNSETSNLFDTIEDMEEDTPIPSPFGYSIVSYPLTEIMVDVMGTEVAESILSKSQTSLSEQAIKEDEVLHTAQSEGTAESGKRDGKIEETRAETGTLIESSAGGSSEGGEGANPVPESYTLPPPVSNQRTQLGLTNWNSLVLPAVPPMYRPFLNQEDEEPVKKSKSGQSTPRSSHGSVKKEPEGDSRPSTRDSKSSKKEKSSLGDEKFCRPGEYVIMVQDVTNPPFLGERPEPAFLILRVAALKKVSSHRGSTPSKRAAKGENAEDIKTKQNVNRK